MWRKLYLGAAYPFSFLYPTVSGAIWQINFFFFFQKWVSKKIPLSEVCRIWMKTLEHVHKASLKKLNLQISCVLNFLDFTVMSCSLTHTAFKYVLLLILGGGSKGTGLMRCFVFLTSTSRIITSMTEQVEHYQGNSWCSDSTDLMLFNFLFIGY